MGNTCNMCSLNFGGRRRQRSVRRLRRTTAPVCRVTRNHALPLGSDRVFLGKPSRRTRLTSSRLSGASRLPALQPLVVCPSGACDRLRSSAASGARQVTRLLARLPRLAAGRLRSCFAAPSATRPDLVHPRGKNFISGGVGPDPGQTLQQSLSQTIVDGSSACFRFRNIGRVLS